MRVSHTLLTLALAGALWWGGHGLWSGAVTATEATAPAPAFGIPGSAYGSLMARLMRDSLYSYWHGGQSAEIAIAKPKAAAVPPPTTPSSNPTPPPAGRFARRGQAPAVPVPLAAGAQEVCKDACCNPATDAVAAMSWIGRRVHDLARLECARTKRNSAFPMSAAHRRFVNASAEWRLRMAYQLDPGDAVLYEILHFQLSRKLAEKPEVQRELVALAEQAIANIDSPNAGMSAALTGAGAAVNLLNDLLRPGLAARDVEAILRRWGQLDRCLARYWALHQQAVEEGWWEDVPPVRQIELDGHARLLGRIADTIRKQLPAGKVTAEIRPYR